MPRPESKTPMALSDDILSPLLQYKKSDAPYIFKKINDFILYKETDAHEFRPILAEIEDSRQTSLASRFKKEKYHEPINDEDIPFDFLGEEDMEDITPYSFMV